MSMKSKIQGLLLHSRGKVSRIVDALLIAIAGLSNILAYYLIEYQLCVANACTGLHITKYWYDTSIAYIIFGVCLLIISVYTFRQKDLALIYALAILLVVAIGSVYSCMSIFAMTIELSTLTAE